jgi:predicted GIY-YIG superfamily endonuclease
MEKILSSIISIVYKASYMYTENILQTGREHKSGNATGYTLQNAAVNMISKCSFNQTTLYMKQK